MKKATAIPFDFVLEQLFTLEPTVRPMFGCHAVYIGDKIMLILRNKPGVHEEDNGIWISTKKEHHASLLKLLPSMRSIQVLGNGQTNWQILPLDADDFEENVNKICNLILKGDSRIGNVPKLRKKRGAKSTDSGRKVKPMKRS